MDGLLLRGVFMAVDDVRRFVESLPTLDEINRRIRENIDERQLLRQMARLAKQRDQAAAHHGQPAEAGAR
jgi:hypothetical protein